MGVRVVTDSGCDLTREECTRAGIEVVPITIIFGPERLRDGIEIDKDTFTRRMAAGEMPTTEPPSIQDFHAVFERLVKGGNEVVAVTLSSKLSKSYENAKNAAAGFGGAVHVIDSLGAAGAESLLALYALECAKAGDGAAEVARRIDPHNLTHANFFAVHDINHLGRSGRLPRALVALGSMLNVSLVLKMNESGEVGLAGQSRSFDKTCELLVDSVLRAIGHAPNCRVAISHVEAPGTAAELAKMIEAKLGHPPRAERVSDSPLTIATHMGPGAVGIFAIVP